MKINLLEFDVKGVNNEKRNLAGLYDGVFIGKNGSKIRRSICQWPMYPSQTI